MPVTSRFFEDHDVVVMPVHPRPAIPHDHSQPQFGRRVIIGGVERDYLDLWRWISPAGAAYLPATVVPIGLSEAGLPIGVQVVGRFLDDRTTLRFGELISDLVTDQHGWQGPSPRPALAGA